MRFLLICVLATAVFVSVGVIADWSGSAEEAAAKSGNGLEKLLTDYLEKRLERARESLRRLQGTGVTTVPDLLAVEDEVDKCLLHLRLATEGKLISLHPVVSELRREFGIPEITRLMEAGRSEVISGAIREYLERKLQRAERAFEIARALYEFGRTTESQLLAEQSKVEGLKLLLEVERIRVR